MWLRVQGHLQEQSTGGASQKTLLLVSREIQKTKADENCVDESSQRKKRGSAAKKLDTT